jgi:hypothetical protein
MALSGEVTNNDNQAGRILPYSCQTSLDKTLKVFPVSQVVTLCATVLKEETLIK